MFWTAFIWVLGVSIGAAFGMMLFVVLFAAFKEVAYAIASRCTQQSAPVQSEGIHPPQRHSDVTIRHAMRPTKADGFDDLLIGANTADALGNAESWPVS